MLTAGQLRRLAIGEGPHLHHVEGVHHLVLDVARRHAAHLQREGQVFRHRHMREQGIVLEHHADAALVGRNVVDGLAAKLDLAMGGGLESGQHHQTGRFPRPRRTEHGDKLTSLDIEIQVLHDECLAIITFLNVAKPNERVVAVKHIQSTALRNLFVMLAEQSTGMAGTQASSGHTPEQFYAAVCHGRSTRHPRAAPGRRIRGVDGTFQTVYPAANTQTQPPETWHPEPDTRGVDHGRR